MAFNVNARFSFMRYLKMKNTAHMFVCILKYIVSGIIMIILAHFVFGFKNLMIHSPVPLNNRSKRVLSVDSFLD